LASGDTISAVIHHSSQGAGEDQVLSTVKEGQRCGNLDGCILVVLKGGVIATDFVALVVEVLEGVREVFK
jgi:hypothetical protein